MLLGSLFWMTDRDEAGIEALAGDETPAINHTYKESKNSDQFIGKVTVSTNSTNSTISRSKVGLEPISKYMKALNAKQAQEAIDDLRDNGNIALANDLELEIRGRCGFLHDVKPPYERTRWAHDLILEYCSNYTPRIDETGDIPISITKSLALTKLRKHLVELDTNEFDKYFMEFLANTNSIQELKAAEFVAKDLQASGAPLKFGMTDDRLVTPSEGVTALHVAFDLYGCVRFGGCESNDFKVLEYCVLTGNCERGWNMFDIYAYTLAPNVYEQVTNILNNMVQASKAKS